MTDADFDSRYAAALREADPVAAVRKLAQEAGVDVDEDGVRMAALMVARLRFERIVRGNPALAREFDAEPAEFARVFKAYHAATAPTSTDPRAEAADFARWWELRRAPRS